MNRRFAVEAHPRQQRRGIIEASFSSITVNGQTLHPRQQRRGIIEAAGTPTAGSIARRSIRVNNDAASLKPVYASNN